jgi:hypothetical protein
MSQLRFESAGVIGSGMLAALFLTTRVERVGKRHYERFRESGQPVMFVFWHGQLLPLIHYHRHEGIVVLVSEHDDGEYVTRVLRRNGFATVRGSSTRGGTRGLKGLVRAAREGHDLAVTPDGPRGPRGRFKPGALAAAQMAGLPVVPVALTSSAGYRVKSWDGFLVPRPFAKITIEYLEPRFLDRATPRVELERMATELGDELNAREGDVAPATPPPKPPTRAPDRGDGR